MIQRIQSLWLLASAALAFISLQVPFFSGNILVNNLKEFRQFNAMSNMILMILTVLLGLAALVNIFLYKDRKLQMRITAGCLVIAIINLALYYFNTQQFVPGEWSFDIRALVAIAIPFFLFFGMRGIYRDNKLMRSLDRLR